MASYQNLTVARDGAIATVTLQRPEVKNALNHQTVDELAAVFDELEQDGQVKGVVLTSGDGAIAGADIKEIAKLDSPEATREMAVRGQGVLGRIAGLSKPVVAALDGPVLGGGSELSMACHARVVGPKLLVGQPEVNLGIIPGYGGTQRLPRIIGLQRGVELLRTGRPIKVAEACELGWATGEPTDDPLGAARALVQRHLDGDVRLGPVDPAPMEVPEPLPEVDIGHCSRAIDAILVDVIQRGLRCALPDGLAIEADGFARCQGTRDFQIGMQNFIENGPRSKATFVHE